MQPYYADDHVTLYHGEALAVLSALPSLSVDAIVADPPYSSGGMFRGDRQAKTSAKYGGFTKTTDGWSATSAGTDFTGDSRDQRSYGYWSALWMSEALRVARPGSVIEVFADWRQVPTTSDAMQAGGWVWRGVMVWDKGIGRPMKGRPRNTVEFVLWGSHGPMEPDRNPVYLDSVYQVAPPRDRDHLTQKPVDLLSSLLRLTAPDAVVLDPFAGSGTSLVAAKATGRKAIGIEIDERHCEVAARRLTQDSIGLVA